MRICLFEDSAVLKLEPLTRTRPAFELRCGATSLGHKQCRYFGVCDFGVLIRPQLMMFYQPDQAATPVNDFAWLRLEPTVLVNGRWLPPPGLATDLTEPCVALIGADLAYAVVHPRQLTYCTENTLSDCLSLWQQTLPSRAAGGRMLVHPWELIDMNEDALLAHRSRRAANTVKR